MKAGISVALSLVGCFTQLFGLSSGIYLIYDWNTMEPFTWLLQSWWLMIGSYFYMWSHADFKYGRTVYIMLQQKFYNNSIKNCNTLPEELENLKSHLNSL